MGLNYLWKRIDKALGIMDYVYAIKSIKLEKIKNKKVNNLNWLCISKYIADIYNRLTPSKGSQDQDQVLGYDEGGCLLIIIAILWIMGGFLELYFARGKETKMLVQKRTSYFNMWGWARSSVVCEFDLVESPTCLVWANYCRLWIMGSMRYITFVFEWVIILQYF